MKRPWFESAAPSLAAPGFDMRNLASVTLDEGIEYDRGSGTLTLDGVRFSVQMLRDFVATIGEREMGPLTLRREGDTILFRMVPPGIGLRGGAAVPETGAPRFEVEGP